MIRGWHAPVLLAAAIAAARPDDPTVAFNRACALAARGERKSAAELFQAAALSTSRELTVRARYNLGWVLAEEARLLLGEDAAQAPPEVRRRSLQLLEQADENWRDCLRWDADHGAARRNLEIVRAWMHVMRQMWENQQENRRPQPPPPTPAAGDATTPESSRTPPPQAPAADQEQTRREVELTLQRVRERERQYRKLQRQTGGRLGPVMVERDW